MRNVCADLEKAKEAEAGLTEMIEHAVADKEEYRKRLTEVDRKYEELSLEYSENSQDLSRAIKHLNTENERLIRLIVRLTEERLANHES